MAESTSCASGFIEPGITSLLSGRPFQTAKICGKVVCASCIDKNVTLKFYYDDAGIKQHMRSKHRVMKFNDNVLRECRKRFQLLHAEETMDVVKELSKMRLETVCILF